MPLNLVPQIFYDIIARVIPGSTILILTGLTISGPQTAYLELQKLASNQTINLWTVTAFVMIAYVFGYILNEFWRLTIDKLTKKRRGRLHKENTEKAIEQLNKRRRLMKEKEIKIDYDDLPKDFIMHDDIRVAEDLEGYRLLKLRAENRLCSYMCTGLLVLLIVNVIMWIRTGIAFNVERLSICLSFSISAIMLFIRAESLNRNYIGGVTRLWLTNHPVKKK